jgi:hypothetical protein
LHEPSPANAERRPQFNLPEMTSQAGRPIRTDFLSTIAKSAWSDDFSIPS